MSRLGDDVSQAFREYVRLIAEKEALEAENAALRAELESLKPRPIEALENCSCCEGPCESPYTCPHCGATRPCGDGSLGMHRV